MTKELTAKAQTENAITFTPEQVETIKKTIAKDATDTELQLFLHQCKRTQLDPFSRQIYFIKRGDKATIQTSIDGLRLIAERSQKYQGQTLPLFLDKEGTWHEVWTQTGYPVAAKVGVHRSDFKEPMYAIARWSAYAPVYNGKVAAMWAKMPDLMLAKVAEALALRKAFPNDLSGLYTGEEMDQAQTVEPGRERVSYTVERIVPNDEADETPHTGRRDISESTVAYPQMDETNDANPLSDEPEKQKAEIRRLMTALGKPATILGVKKITNVTMNPKNYSVIIELLQKQLDFEKA